MAKKLHLQHVKSAVKSKAPLAADLEFGELAINYNNESPAIYIKDSASGIVEFNPITIDSAMSSSHRRLLTMNLLRRPCGTISMTG